MTLFICNTITTHAFMRATPFSSMRFFVGRKKEGREKREEITREASMYLSSRESEVVAVNKIQETSNAS